VEDAWCQVRAAPPDRNAMDWIHVRCSWCTAVHRAPAERPLVTCPACGGEIAEITEPPGALWAGNALITPEALEAGLPQRPRPQGVDRLRGPLGNGLRDVLVRGTPLLVDAPLVTGRDDALGVVLHVTDALDLAAHVPLAVDPRDAPPGTVALVIEALGAEGAGPSTGLALAGLAASARRRCRVLLADPLTPSPVRAVALRLWLADAAGRLPALLGEQVAGA
jgi:hypothetical protein